VAGLTLDGAGVLPRSFFDASAVDVAPRLLGCVLAASSGDGEVAVAVTEVEAYAGESDPASHAYRGPTRRNAVMYGAPGHAYVYFTYGMYFCVNLVCSPEGTATAVLLRAGAVVTGVELARQRRSAGSARSAGSVRSAGSAGSVRSAGSVGSARGALADRDLARGPARLCQALGVDRAQNGLDVCDPASPLRILAGPALDRGRDQGLGTVGVVCSGPRVGVSRAAEVPWRFWLEGEPSVSVYRAHTPRRVNPSGGR
jgi:DNA-3-methyladenine glycosylase